MDGKRRVVSENGILQNIGLHNDQSILSEREIAELNTSILQYLKPILQKERHIYHILEQKLIDTQSNSLQYSDLIPNEISENYLQKKWSNIIKLQKNLHELENKNKILENRNNELMSVINELTLKLETKSSTESLKKIDWIPDTLKASLKYHTASITAIVIHPFNPYLITASQDGMIVFWNLLDLSEPITQIKTAHTSSINCLKFQPNSSNLISCSNDQTIKIWDLSNINNLNKTPMKILTGHEHVISSLSINKENPNILISCSRDQNIKIWDLQTGWTVDNIIGHSDWVRCIDSVGDYIISGSSDTSIRLTHWPSNTGIGLCIGNTQVIEDVKFLPLECNKYLDNLKNDGGDTDIEDNKIYEKLGYKYAVSCGRDSLIKFWKLPKPEFNPITGDPIVNSINPYGECILQLKGHLTWVKKLEIHYNCKNLISCSDDGTIKFWDLTNLNDSNELIKPIKTLNEHGNFINCITIAQPKGELIDDNIRCYLASGGVNRTVNVWV